MSVARIAQRQSGSATYDIGSGSETMEMGDTLPVPVDMTANNGNVEFRVIIEGRPQVVGENYYCDLEFSFTTVNDWGMLIKETSTTTCQVGQAQGINDVIKAALIDISPNPASDHYRVTMEGPTARPSLMNLYQIDGTLLKSVAMEGANSLKFDSRDLSAGILL